MKRLYRIVIALALILAVCGILCGRILLAPETDLDPVEVNHILQCAEQYIEDPENPDISMPEGDYILFDRNGTTVYVSGDPVAAATASSPVEALKAGYPSSPIHSGEKFLGTLVLTKNRETQLRENKFRILRVLIVMFTLTSLVMIAYLIYVKVRIVDPFREMEAFAGRVAAGDLELPLKKEKDELFGAFSTSFDLMREELRASREREEELKRKERELVASLSHDLKTPITGIKLVCELLSVKLQDADTLEKIKRIEERTEQMELLVSDLLTSSIEDLKELKVVGTDVSASELHSLIRKHDDKKRVKETPCPECLINIDLQRMDQVIGNILSNSYKYAGTPIEAEYTIIEDMLELKLRDFGPGVDPEELPRLTDRYFRGEAASAGSNPGSGLGLYIARNLMERMGGNLLCSNAEPGLLVTLLIPLSR